MQPLYYVFLIVLIPLALFYYRPPQKPTSKPEAKKTNIIPFPTSLVKLEAQPVENPPFVPPLTCSDCGVEEEGLVFEYDDYDDPLCVDCRQMRRPGGY